MPCGHAAPDTVPSRRSEPRTAWWCRGACSRSHGRAGPACRQSGWCVERLNLDFSSTESTTAWPRIDVATFPELAAKPDPSTASFSVVADRGLPDPLTEAREMPTPSMRDRPVVASPARAGQVSTSRRSPQRAMPVARLLTQQPATPRHDRSCQRHTVGLQRRCRIAIVPPLAAQEEIRPARRASARSRARRSLRAARPQR